MEVVAEAEQTDTDAVLMQRVQRGDTAAFAALVDRFKNPVMALVCRMLKESSDAEDIAQQVFIQVYKSRDRYRATAKFSTWLFTIAKNLCLNELRRRSRHPTESMDIPVGEEGDAFTTDHEDTVSASPPEAILQGELVSKIDEAISILPDHQRIALELCRQEELSYEDISDVLGCSVAATKSLIHRARETIKSRIKPYIATGVWKD